MKTVWHKTAAPGTSFPELTEDIKCDVAIIGAGYSGLCTAFFLAQRNIDVVVLEATEPGAGASGRNMGCWVPSFSMITPDKLAQQIGAEKATTACRLIAGAGVGDFIKEHNIGCEDAGGGLLMVSAKQKKLDELANMAAQWNKYGGDIDVLGKPDLQGYINSDHYHGGILYKNAGRLNPLSYVRGLAQKSQKLGARIFAHSPVSHAHKATSGWTLRTGGGTVSSQRVIVASNAFKLPFMPALNRNYYKLKLAMIASAPLDGGGRDYTPSLIPFSDMDVGGLFGARYDGQGRLISSVMPTFLSSASASQVARPYWRRFRKIFPHSPGKITWESSWTGYETITKNMWPTVINLEENMFAISGHAGSGIAQSLVMGDELAGWLSGDKTSHISPFFSELQPKTTNRLLSGFLNHIALPLARHMLY